MSDLRGVGSDRRHHRHGCRRHLLTRDGQKLSGHLLRELAHMPQILLRLLPSRPRRHDGAAGLLSASASERRLTNGTIAPWRWRCGRKTRRRRSSDDKKRSR
eukprot:753913-Hanusia_phi.AAC.4